MCACVRARVCATAYWWLEFRCWPIFHSVGAMLSLCVPPHPSRVHRPRPNLQLDVLGVIVLGGGSILRVGPTQMAVGTYRRGPRDLPCLSHHVRHGKKVPSMLGEWAPTYTTSASNLTLDFPTSRTAGNRVLLFIRCPVCGILLQARMDYDARL